MSEDIRALAFTNGTASHVWRFDPIARRMNQETPHQMFITKNDAWNGEIVGANLVILELTTGHHVVDTCHNLGAKVIFEADDAALDTYGRERKHLQKIGPGFRSNMIQTIRKCDALTVTNEALAQNYARFTDKPIYVLPIYMDYDYYGDAIKMKMPERNTDEVRIGWFGSKSHFEDLRMVLPAIKNVLEKHKNVKFVYVGYGHGSTNLAQMTVWGEEEVFGEIPRDRREFAEGVTEAYWPFRHRILSFDIGICPLVDDEFNQAKVNTKWQEYSVLETPSVVSPTVYGESVRHGETGFIARTSDDWEQYLAKLVEDADLRQRMGQAAAKEVAEKWNMDDYWEKWVDVYLKTLNG